MHWSFDHDGDKAMACGVFVQLLAVHKLGLLSRGSRFCLEMTQVQTKDAASTVASVLSWCKFVDLLVAFLFLFLRHGGSACRQFSSVYF